MSKWIVWSKPAPLKVIVAGMVVAIVTAILLVFLLRWLGLGDRIVRYAVTIVAVVAGMGYVNTHRPKPESTQP